MNKSLLLLVSNLFFVLHLAFSQVSYLNPEELIWLKNHKDSINIFVECNFPPFIYVENETIKGASYDILKRIEIDLGISFNFTKCENLKDILERMKSSGCNIVTSVKKTDERKKFMIFSESYYEVPVIIATHKRIDEALDYRKLDQYIIGVGAEYSIYYHLKNNYPNYKLKVYDTDMECLQNLALGNIDVALTDIASVSYLVQKKDINDIRISNVIPFSYNLAFGFPLGQDTLLNILNKSIANISKNETAKLLDSWIVLDIGKSNEYKIIIKYILIISLIIILLSLFVFVWNRILKQQVNLKTNLLNEELSKRIRAEKGLQLTNQKLKESLEKAEENKVIIQRQYNELQTSEEEIRTNNEQLIVTTEALEENNNELIIAKEKAEGSEAFMYMLINTIPDLVWLKDLDGLYLKCNRRFEDFLGAKETDILMKTDYDFVDEKLADFFRSHDKAAMKADKPTMNEEQVTFANDGHEEFLETIKMPLRNSENKIIGILGVGRNITERKEWTQELLVAKEKAEESDQLKTEFIHNMSHEIRTPMNGILGFSKFLNNEKLSPEKRKQYINIIHNSGNQLMRIIDDILEISKLGTKQVKAIEKEICLNDLLLEQFSIFDIKAKENKTPLYLKKGLSDKESFIFTDASKLNKILSNLLENALKFTTEGFVEFGYQLKHENIELYVKDTGIGIMPEKQKTIFLRFSQEEKELSKHVGGLGLGLSIAKENAELLGGEIILKSEKGKGATFFITIPYKPSNTEKTILEKDNDKIIEKPDKCTILIVEDEEVNCLYIETLLEDEIELNCNTLHAKNGKEAVDICRNNKAVDIVLMDLKMPIMNGYEATELIKVFRPDLPIIAQTAYTTHEDKEKSFSAGCDDFISKPISVETLNNIINKYLIRK